MLIHFDRPECKKHKKPLEYICMSSGCLCQIHLCASCTHQHCKKYSKSDFMKETNFYKQIQIETDITEKQYGFLDKHFPIEASADLLSSKNEEGIKMVELIIKIANEDKRIIFKFIDEFSQSHLGVKRKLQNLQTISDRKYISSIQDSSLLSIIINLSSVQGLQRLRKKIINCQNIAKKYNQFLAATLRYGDNTSSLILGLNIKINPLKEVIRQLISSEKTDVRDLTNERQEIIEKKLSSENARRQVNNCQQVFAQSPISPKKIKLLMPRNRPKTSSSTDKEN